MIYLKYIGLERELH